jgi:hypothetical protein
MAAAPIVEGFSVSHAAILDGTTAATETDIYGVRSGSLALDTSSYDNTGDDSVLSTWNWFTYATLTIDSGYIPFDLIALLTGSSITSSGVSPADYWSMDLWNEDSLNTPTRPVLIRVPSKTALGVVRSLDFVIYKVQFDPIKFTGPTYKDGLVVNYTGKALISNFDEKGVQLLKADGTTKTRAIGRVVSRPRV